MSEILALLVCVPRSHPVINQKFYLLCDISFTIAGILSVLCIVSYCLGQYSVLKKIKMVQWMIKQHKCRPPQISPPVCSFLIMHPQSLVLTNTSALLWPNCLREHKMGVCLAHSSESFGFMLGRTSWKQGHVLRKSFTSWHVGNREKICPQWPTSFSGPIFWISRTFHNNANQWRLSIQYMGVWMALVSQDITTSKYWKMLFYFSFYWKQILLLYNISQLQQPLSLLFLVLPTSPPIWTHSLYVPY